MYTLVIFSLAPYWTLLWNNKMCQCKQNRHGTTRFFFSFFSSQSFLRLNLIQKSTLTKTIKNDRLSLGLSIIFDPVHSLIHHDYVSVNLSTRFESLPDSASTVSNLILNLISVNPIHISWNSWIFNHNYNTLTWSWSTLRKHRFIALYVLSLIIYIQLGPISTIMFNSCIIYPQSFMTPNLI